MKQTILVADDDPAVRRMLCRVLAEECYDVIVMADSLEAFELCDRNNVNLLVLNLNPPIGIGPRILKQLSTASPFLPVIIVTAQSDQITPALAAGVDAVMEKPLDLLKLLQTIEDLLAEPMEARINRGNRRRAELDPLSGNLTTALRSSGSIGGAALPTAHPAAPL